MMNNCRFLLDAPMPECIPVADKPLSLGGKIEYLKIEEFQKRIGCIYREGISINSDTQMSRFRESIGLLSNAKELKEQVKKVLKATSNNLVICKMGKLGYGVFASKKIPKGTVVAIYSGTLVIGDKNEGDHSIGYFGTRMSFSGKQHRGIASFMQHLPEAPRCEDAATHAKMGKMAMQIFGVSAKEMHVSENDISEEGLKLNIELYSTEFESPEMRKRVVTENIRREYLDFDGVPVIALVTTKKVKSNDQLGFNYGDIFWRSRDMTPEFFDRSGNVLSRNLYKRTCGQLQFNTFTYTGVYKPLVDSLKQGRTVVTVKGDDQKLHRVSAGTLMFLLLKANACKLEINPLVDLLRDSDVH